MGNRLKELRKQRRWTAEEAADAIGVSRSQYIKLERGERRLKDTYIDQAAKAFGVRPGDILADDRSSADDDLLLKFRQLEQLEPEEAESVRKSVNRLLDGALRDANPWGKTKG